MLDFVASLALTASLQAADWACAPADGYGDVSAHLEALRQADQADRRGGMGREVAERDRERLAQVEVYLQGDCLSTGRDHHNAALIFQHGGAPEHYQTAWRLSVRAVELGDDGAAWLIPRAIDRYFMSQGYRQLYATNSRGELRDPQAGPEGGFILCLWPVVDAVSEAERTALGVRTVEQQLAMIAERNGEDAGRFCETDAQDPPRGVFPGYW